MFYEKTDFETLVQRQKIFGYSVEDINMLMTPMVLHGMEAIGSMGNDTPPSILSNKPQLLYTYFKHFFLRIKNRKKKTVIFVNIKVVTFVY